MKLYFILILFAVSLASAAQQSTKIKNLEAKRKAALSEIEATGKQLSQTKESQTNLLARLNLIDLQISTRKEVISLLNQEIKALESEMDQTGVNIGQLETELEQKKIKYAKSLRKIQVRRNFQDQVLFILSAENLAQSYRRFRYLKEYSDWQRTQVKEIMEQQQLLSQRKESLGNSRNSKLQLLHDREKESNKLIQEESNKKTEIQVLNKKEKELKSELDKKKKLAQNLDKQIERAIEDEIKKSRKEAEKAQQAVIEKTSEPKASSGKTEKTVTASTPTTTGSSKEVRVAETEGGYAMTKEEQKLSSDFVNNKGKLPYPLKGSYKIVSRFGLHKHQDLKYVEVNNNGIDIQIRTESDALSVFNGVVSKIFTLSGANNVIIVRHGNYLTVYSNLSEVYVRTGESIKTGQKIGKIFSDPEEGSASVLHFEIWKETTKLNPEDWLN